jgi:hypothetical protein
MKIGKLIEFRQKSDFQELEPNFADRF